MSDMCHRQQDQVNAVHRVCSRAVDDHVVAGDGFVASASCPFDGLANRPLPVTTCPSCLRAYDVNWMDSPTREVGEHHRLLPLGVAVADAAGRLVVPAVLACVKVEA